MAKAIKAENLSKAYQLGDFGTGTISRDLERYWARIRGKEDPFLKVGEVNDRTTKGSSDIVWSLNDLNFEIEQGDAVGIIGRNGAGKSTLLKVLSRVTSPTTGSVKLKGRIASLLEVGTGFHPELTGRENIFLNGAILGMRKAEIKQKFDQIVDFSGVERYVDTPVKRYSSGMYVRLAFAVAAHLESEILIVDEVLAVGDAEFQKKCIGKMGDVSAKEGRTILFVSHNMSAIKGLCKKGILLDRGQLKMYEGLDNVIDAYINNFSKTEEVKYTDHSLKWLGIDKREFKGSQKLAIKMNFALELHDTSFFIDFGIGKSFSDYVLHLPHRLLSDEPYTVKGKGEFQITLNIDACYLVPGDYKLTIYIYDYLKNTILWVSNIDAFSIADGKEWGNTITPSELNGSIIPPFSLNIDSIN